MGDPIDIGKIRVGDTIRVVNPTSDVTITVQEIVPMGAIVMLREGLRGFGGRPGDGPDAFNHFFLVERPTHKHARMLTELLRGKQTVPEVLLTHEVAKYLPLPPKKTAKKAGRRKTRRAKTPVTL
jgi:hypothetical protein